MPDIGWRQINEFSSKSDGIEFFATYRDQYKGNHPRMAIDKVVFALPSQPLGHRPFGHMEPTPTKLFRSYAEFLSPLRIGPRLQRAASPEAKNNGRILKRTGRSKSTQKSHCRSASPCR